MKILQLGKFYPIKGGVEKVMYDLVQGLTEKNIYCDMLCASEVNESYNIKLNSKGNIICTSTWKKLFATMISPSMITTLRKICSDYDIIHVHHPDPMAALALYFSNYKGKVVLHWHSDILKQKFILKFYLPLQTWLIKRADVIIGTTPKYLSESPFLQLKNLNKVSVPIGITPIKIEQAKSKEIKDKYKNKKIIFSLGRLVGYKGFSYLIKAAKYLPDNYIILIGGSGPQKQELEEIINNENLKSKVELLGRISDEDLPAYYGACDIYVLSSIWKTEAFGIVQIEAMSCGKPVIATRIEGSGVDWVNQNEVSGLNVNPENSKEIANAIIKILSDETKYKNYSEGAHDRFLSHFTKDRMINKVITIYKNLLND